MDPVLQAQQQAQGAPPVDPTLAVPSAPFFVNPAYATPNQRAELYAYSKELMSPTPVNNWAQGLGSIARALMGGWEGHQADIQEQASQAQNKQDFANTVGAIDSPSPASGNNGGSEPAIAASAQANPADAGAVASYLQQSASARGIDPAVAAKVLGGESGGNVAAVGDDGSSFGPLQLHYGGISKDYPHAGLGDAFTASTGLNARDPSTWQKQIDFALDTAKTQGWAPWANTRDKYGLQNFSGIGPNRTGPAAPPPQGAPTTVAPSGAGPQNPSPVAAATAGGAPEGMPPLTVTRAPMAPQASIPPQHAMLAQALAAPQGRTMNGLPVSAGAIGELMGNANISPDMKALAQGLLAPRPVSDALGNQHMIYQNQPVQGDPIFQGGVLRDQGTGSVPAVVGGSLNAPSNTMVPPAAAGQPSGVPNADPGAAFAPTGPLGQMATAQAATAARVGQIGDTAKEYNSQYLQAQNDEATAREAAYPLHQLQGVLEANGGMLPTGKLAPELMSGTSVANMIGNILGVQVPSDLPPMELLNKYGKQLSQKMAANLHTNPTNMDLESTGETTPGTTLSNTTNLHLIDNLARLNDLSVKYAQAKQQFYRANGNSLDGFQQAWTNSIDKGNAIPLGKYPVATKQGRDGELYDKVPSTDQSGFSWVKHGAVQ